MILKKKSYLFRFSTFLSVVLIAVELGACGNQKGTQNEGEDLKFSTLASIEAYSSQAHPEVLKHFSPESIVVTPSKKSFSRPVRPPANLNLSAISLAYSIEGVGYAEKKNRIFRNIPPKDLPRGHSYNFIIFASGDYIFGMVEDNWEYGAKHLQIAQGNPVLAAGEFYLDQNGQYNFNILSGSLVLAILHKYPEYQTVLKSSVTHFFNEEMRSEVAISDKGLLPHSLPTLDEQNGLCSEAYFYLNNLTICTEITKSD